MTRSTDQDRLLLRVAQLYHEQDLTQQEVGERLHLTRWQVGRLLQRAKKMGIVRVEIVHPDARRHQIEATLCARAGLKDAIVVPGSSDPAQSMRLVARAAADYLADLEPRPTSVAISWGRTMAALANAISPGWAKNVTVIQANGGLSLPGEGSPANVIGQLAHHGQGRPVFLPAPALVGSPDLAEALRNEEQVRSVLAMARSADVLVFSCGGLCPDSVLIGSGCISLSDVTQAEEAGCVGDVVARYINADGYPVSEELEARTIGLTLTDVINAKLSIAVAAGQAKFQIAEAVVRRGLCDILVTDEATASYLTRQF